MRTSELIEDLKKCDENALVFVEIPEIEYEFSVPTCDESNTELFDLFEDFKYKIVDAENETEAFKIIKNLVDSALDVASTQIDREVSGSIDSYSTGDIHISEIENSYGVIRIKI